MEVSIYGDKDDPESEKPPLHNPVPFPAASSTAVCKPTPLLGRLSLATLHTAPLDEQYAAHDWPAEATPQPVSGLTPDTQSADDVEPMLKVVWFESGHSVQGGPPPESPYDPLRHTQAADPTSETASVAHG